MLLLVGAGSALLPPSGGPANSLIMPVDEQSAFPAYAPSLVHSHKMPLGVLNLLALSPEQRREKRKRNRKLRELEKQQTVGSGNINLISAQTFGSRHPVLPGDSVDAFAGTPAAPQMGPSSRWTQLLAIIDEQRKEGSWAEDRAGPRDAAQHLAAMKLLAVKEPTTTHSAFTMTPFQLMHVAAGAAFSAPLAVVGGLATAFRSWSSKNADIAPPAPAAQQQQESQTVAEAEPTAYWIGSNGPKEMVVAESVAQTTVAHRKPRRQQQQQQQQEKQLNTALKSAKSDKQAEASQFATANRQALQVATDSISKLQTTANVANKTAEAEEVAAAVKRLAMRKLESVAEKAEKEAAVVAKKAAAERSKADASAAKRAEVAEEKRKVERKAGAAASIAQKVASYRESAAKAEGNYEAEDQAERSKTAADKVAALTKAIESKVSPQTALRRNETDRPVLVSKAQEAIRFAEKEVAAKAAQEKQAALRLEQIKKIVAQRSKERDSAKRKVAMEAAEALSDVQSAEEAARAKMDAAKAVHAAAKAKAGVDAAEALSIAKKEVGTPAAKSASKARAEASLKLFAAATAKREAAVKAKVAADARAAAATKKQAAMRATLVATDHKAPAKAAAKADSKPEHKETGHANKQDALEHTATSLVAHPASKPTEVVAKGGSEFPAVGRFLGEAKKVNSGRWAQLATLSTKVAALKNLQEKDTSQ